MSGARRQLAEIGVLVLTGLGVVTCMAREPARGPIAATPPAPPPTSTAPEVAAAPSTSNSASPVASASAAPVASGVPSAVAIKPGMLALPRFFAEARALADGSRKDHLRIVWVGDSHTAADLWTGAVRNQLTKKLGAGGPGFVHVGWAENKYRHDGVRLEILEKWSVLPVPYPTTKRDGDGVYGLGGVRLVPASGDARSTVEVLASAAPKAAKLTWDLAYRPGDDGKVRASVDGDPAELTDVTKSPHGIRHHKFTSRGATGKLQVSTSGRPELLGVVIEGDTPGVVLDTLGLNGARVATWTARDDAAWVEELTRRHANLVVLAFGTNESSDVAPKSEKYEAEADKLLTRVQRASPEADCLVILPMDRGGTEFPARLAIISEGLTAAAKRHGCATWSALSAMGGPGSMSAWARESPPRGGADGIHLTPKGYQYLGERLAKDLLVALEPLVHRQRVTIRWRKASLHAQDLPGAPR